MFVNYVPENKTILGWFPQTNQYHPLSVIYLEKSHPQNDRKGQQFIYVILTASWLGGCYILLHSRSDRMTFPYIPSMGNPDCPSVNGATPDYQAEKKQPFFRTRIRLSIHHHIYPSPWIFQWKLLALPCPTEAAKALRHRFRSSRPLRQLMATSTALLGESDSTGISGGSRWKFLNGRGRLMRSTNI